MKAAASEMTSESETPTMTRDRTSAPVPGSTPKGCAALIPPHGAFGIDPSSMLSREMSPFVGLMTPSFHSRGARTASTSAKTTIPRTTRVGLSLRRRARKSSHGLRPSMAFAFPSVSVTWTDAGSISVGVVAMCGPPGWRRTHGCAGRDHRRSV